MEKNVWSISMMEHEVIDMLKDFYYEKLRTKFSMYLTNPYPMDVQLN